MYFTQGCLVFFLISCESNSGCNPGHLKADTEVAYMSCTTRDKCPGMSLLDSGCPSIRAWSFSRSCFATKTPRGFLIYLRDDTGAYFREVNCNPNLVSNQGSVGMDNNGR